MYCVRVGVIGLNFKTADLSLREAMARAAQSLADERAIFSRYPVVLLSTCNRTEIYFSAEDLAEAHSDLLAYLRTQIAGAFEHRLYSYFGIDAFAHLCRVAAGLDSAIVAETEIQRQVKVAYARASQLFALPGCVHYAFQKALKVGKLIRNQWAGRSIYGTMWQTTEWKGKRILLVGYSEINRGFASFLMHKGVERFALCTRSPSQVRLEGVEVCDRRALDRWSEYDVVVCASQADDFLIRGAGRGEQVIFDLSVPRNVDPEVGKSAKLYNIDQLTGENPEGSRCESLVWENVIRLARIYRTKTQRAQGIGERESRLLCSPCQSQRGQAVQSLSQSRHEGLIHIHAVRDTTSSQRG